MANIAYVRVSTIEQNEQRQLDALKAHKIDEWFTEKVSAKDTNRPQLQAMLKYARKGDTIFIHDLSRLARSTKDLLDIVQTLTKKGVELKSNKENIDTSNPMGRMVLTMIGAIAEFERDNLLERQREGIAIAKAKGAYKGRKKIQYPDNWTDIYNTWKNRGMTAKEAFTQIGVSNVTFYKMVNEYESEVAV